MSGRSVLSARDFFFMLLAVAFLFGCVASSHRSGKTLAPGQFSVGFAYDGLNNIEEEGLDMVHLMAMDGRVGLLKGLDIGAEHTWDMTGGNEGLFSTWWGDAKVQLNNRDNVVGKPILSLGVIKGYVYHEDADTHITSFPIIVSIPTSERMTPYFIYRFENMTADFFPDEWDDTRHGFFLGTEIVKGGEGALTPVFGLDVGLLTSLYGGDGDMMLVLNAGVSFTSR